MGGGLSSNSEKYLTISIDINLHTSISINTLLYFLQTQESAKDTVTQDE